MESTHYGLNAPRAPLLRRFVLVLVLVVVVAVLESW
jgi:hypothetical protein